MLNETQVTRVICLLCDTVHGNWLLTYWYHLPSPVRTAEADHTATTRANAPINIHVHEKHHSGQSLYVSLSIMIILLGRRRRTSVTSRSAGSSTPPRGNVLMFENQKATPWRWNSQRGCSSYNNKFKVCFLLTHHGYLFTTRMRIWLVH